MLVKVCLVLWGMEANQIVVIILFWVYVIVCECVCW